MRKFARSAVALSLFGAFALGGTLLSYAVLPLVPGRRNGQLIVRAVWRFLVDVFVWTRLISLDASALRPVKGRIVVANHPSLIDVVILTALIPDVYSVAKSELKRNLFFGRVIDRVMIANDENVLEKAGKILENGGNILIFPEGTRTPIGGSDVKLKRGAAQLAIRLGVPICPVRIEMSRRILARSQSILDMGEEPVVYRFETREEIVPPPASVANRSGAIAVTGAIESAVLRSGNFGC